MDKLSNDFLAEALSCATLHEKNGSGTVGDLRSVAAVDGTVFCKRRTDLTKRFCGNALPDTIILGNSDGLFLLGLGVRPLDGHRRDLLIEQPLFLRLGSLLERRRGECVLFATGDTLGLCHLL